MEVTPDWQHTEDFWMVSRTAIVEEHYFDNENEARAFAKTNPGFTVEAPIVNQQGSPDGDTPQAEK